MGGAYNKYHLDFEFPKLDTNIGDNKRIYQILDDNGIIVKSIVIPVFLNLYDDLDNDEIFEGLYSLN